MERSTTRLAHWERRVHVPLLVLGVLFIVGASVYALVSDLHPLALLLAVAVMFIAWIAFGVDYIVRVALAPRGLRLSWIFHHPLELLAVVLPVFRAVRVVDLLRGVPGYTSGTRSMMRAQIVITALAYALVFIYFIALSTLVAERDAPNSTITNFPDAMWWAAVTITTVGYGDVVPVTGLGRAYAVLLMLGGIVIIGLASGTAVSYINERLRNVAANPAHHPVESEHASSATNSGVAGATAPNDSPPADSPPGGHGHA